MEQAASPWLYPLFVLFTIELKQLMGISHSQYLRPLMLLKLHIVHLIATLNALSTSMAVGSFKGTSMKREETSQLYKTRMCSESIARVSYFIGKTENIANAILVGGKRLKFFFQLFLQWIITIIILEIIWQNLKQPFFGISEHRSEESLKSEVARPPDGVTEISATITTAVKRAPSSSSDSWIVHLLRKVFEVRRHDKVV